MYTFSYIFVTFFGSWAVESNAYSIPETYLRLGSVMVPRIEEAFDSRNLLPSTALDPFF